MKKTCLTRVKDPLHYDQSTRYSMVLYQSKLNSVGTDRVELELRCNILMTWNNALI